MKAPGYAALIVALGLLSDGKVYDLVLGMGDGSMRTISSVTGDGHAIIRDSKLVSNGNPSVVAQRCAK